MFCGECGVKLKEGAKFCPKCGAPTKLDNESISDEEILENKITNESEIKVANTEVVEENVNKEKSVEDVIVEKINTNENISHDRSNVSTKKSKKGLIGIILVFIILIAIVSIFIIKYLDQEEPIDEVWGQKYYVYLKGIKNDNKKKEAGLPEKLDDAKIGFHQITGQKNPIMVITYEQNDDTYSNVYYIEEEKVNVLVYNEPTDIEFLYNIEEKEYNYYVHFDNDTVNEYTKLESQLNDSTNNNDTYTFDKQNDNFDNTFIDPDIEERYIQYDDDLSNKELKDLIENGIEEYKETDQLITDKVKDNVENQLSRLEEKKKTEITTNNLHEQLGEHIKWFIGAYLGTVYGWPEVFEYKEVNIDIPGNDLYKDMMKYELVGLTSIEQLKNDLAKYVDKNKFSDLPTLDELDSDTLGNNLIEYNGKVYWLSGGVGCGPYFKDDYQLISSENGITKVLIKEYDCLMDGVMENITLTFTYNKDIKGYLITDWNVDSNY